MMKKTICICAVIGIGLLSPLISLADSSLETQLMSYVDLAISLGRGIGILGAVAGAAGMIFSPNEEGKRKFKTVLIGCVVLALASVIVNTIWDTKQ